MTEVGLSVLFGERLALVAGRSIGLITNQTGINRQFRTNLALFAEHPKVELAAIFSPEHGVAGSAQAGIEIGSAIGKEETDPGPQPLWRDTAADPGDACRDRCVGI